MSDELHDMLCAHDAVTVVEVGRLTSVIRDYHVSCDACGRAQFVFYASSAAMALDAFDERADRARRLAEDGLSIVSYALRSDAAPLLQEV